MTITLPGEQPLPSAHRHAGAIEAAVRERCPSLADVIVHTEPEEAPAPPTQRLSASRGSGGDASRRGSRRRPGPTQSKLTAAAAPTASSTPE